MFNERGGTRALSKMNSMPSVKALRRWLVFVALLRLLSVYLGFLHYTRLQRNLFVKQPDLVTTLYGRTFATWTATSFMLCLICAHNPCNQGVYGATLASFILAFVHLGSEVVIFDTMSWKSGLSPLLIAGVSMLWMGAGWNYYTAWQQEFSEEIDSEGPAKSD